MVIAELRTLAFANLGHYFDAQLAGNPKLLTLEQTAALQEATVDIVGSTPPFDPDNERIRS